ncbi:response regulator [Reyranella sp. CPCC 100927]|uniref:response regulator n=1 Tax=Reyranella sp. CPCC 100927 TaxID=2599616 RepID=UPI0011B45CFA|nr:response regulator [Reyranella sp. CPCC 100927]TWT03217.1 response regulator [Reyranella sp. CPCC 100927]
MSDATADKAHVLVVDDDQRLRELLRTFLSRNGFRVTVAGDAPEARDRLTSMDFDMMVLDVMMPGENGLDLTAALRQQKKAIPILMLTAMGDAKDRIAGLERGADDYLPKPFEPRELLLRINSILRRATAQATPVPMAPVVAVVRLGELRFDTKRGELTRGEKRVKLTDAERALLSVFALNLGQDMSRETLARLVGGEVNVRTIDVQVTRLRRKIEDDPKFPRYLQTVRGTGYRLAGDA